MNLPRSIRIPDDVMSRLVADEVVILDLASGNYYGLDAVGARIWQLLSLGKSPSDVRDALLLEYDVAADIFEADMLRLFAELEARGLLAIA